MKRKKKKEEEEGGCQWTVKTACTRIQTVMGLGLGLPDSRTLRSKFLFCKLLRWFLLWQPELTMTLTFSLGAPSRAGEIEGSICLCGWFSWMFHCIFKVIRISYITDSHFLERNLRPCPKASWLEYRFLRRQVRWSSIPISWRISHSFWWSTQ